MPIRRDLLKFYPDNWKEISYFVRFVREGGLCENCGRNHGDIIHQLNDGRWFDKPHNTWRDKDGRICFWPNIFEFGSGKYVKVYLAAAHKEHDPRISGDEQYDKIASWCQKCHLNHDRPHHIKIRRFMNRSKFATGDLFLGDYSNVELLFITS
jgi:hypothetical protein